MVNFRLEFRDLKALMKLSYDETYPN